MFSIGSNLSLQWWRQLPQLVVYADRFAGRGGLMHWPRCLAALFVVLALAGCAMEKRARCGVLRWISSQGVWRDDLDLTMWSGNEVLKAAIGDGNCPSNLSIDADALMSLIRLDRERRFQVSSNRGVVYLGPGKVDARNIDFPIFRNPAGKPINHVGDLVSVPFNVACGRCRWPRPSPKPA
jgi:hypothetical protein